MADETKEKQYQDCIALRNRIGLMPLGLMANQTWYDDPKRLTFVLSRYKFVSKMLAGSARVLEVGCADAFASRIVASEVGKLVVSDFDPVFIADVKARQVDKFGFETIIHDMTVGPLSGDYDAAYSMDVLEHIYASDEDRFLSNIAGSVTETGIVILGSPSIHSQQYASPPSKVGHVNCKDARGLRLLCQKYFHSVFIFSMNDEMVHTGFYPMAHYFLALCCHKKQRVV